MKTVDPCTADMLLHLPLRIVHNPTVAPYDHIGVDGWWPVWIVNGAIWNRLAEVKDGYLVAK